LRVENDREELGQVGRYPYLPLKGTYPEHMMELSS